MKLLSRSTFLPVFLLFAVFFIAVIIASHLSNDKKPGDMGFGMKEACLLVINPEVEDWGPEILAGKLHVRRTREAMPFSPQHPETIDWDMRNTKLSNTYQLFLHSLDPVRVLINGYVNTKDPAYFLLAKGILESWISYERNTEKPNYYSWAYHSTSERVWSLIYFICVAEADSLINSGFREELLKQLSCHGDWLADEINYVKNHNQGIFQDKALIAIAYFIQCGKSEEWKKLAGERLKKQLEYAFTSEGVHVENASYYNILVTRELILTSEFLRLLDDGFANYLTEKAEKASLFTMHMSYPGSQRVPYGDSHSHFHDKGGETRANTLTGMIYPKAYKEYFASLGKRGVAPQEVYRVFPRSGYAAMRENWSLGPDGMKQTMLTFKSGFTSKTHKHADDNSLTLYTCGQAVLIDPGFYSYERSHPYYPYSSSPSAHNMIVPNGQSYSITKSDYQKAGILDYGRTENYDWVAGYNRIYPGIEWDRWLYWLRPDAVLIFDDMVSDQIQDYEQYFHFAENIAVKKVLNDEVIVDIGNTGQTLRIRQLDGCDDVRIINGLEGKEISIVSRKIKEAILTVSVAFRKKGKSTSFVTLITIGDAKNESRKYVYDPQKNEFCVQKHDNSFTIKLSSRPRSRMGNVSVSYKGDDRYIIDPTISNGGNSSFCWYIYDIKERKLEHRGKYSQLARLEYTFKNRSDYALFLYMKNKYGETRKTLAAVLRYNKGASVFEKIRYDPSELDFSIKEMGFDCISGNWYRFKADTKYFSENIVKYRWYIYKNDIYHKVMGGNSVIEVEFPEPGRYNVTFYIRNCFGEVIFNRFKTIVIGDNGKNPREEIK